MGRMKKAAAVVVVLAAVGIGVGIGGGHLLSQQRAAISADDAEKKFDLTNA